MAMAMIELDNGMLIVTYAPPHLQLAMYICGSRSLSPTKPRGN